MLVENRRGHQKGWIPEPYGGGVEISQEIPEHWIVHQAAGPDPEVDPQIEGVGAQSCQRHRALDLQGQGRPVATVHVNLEVAALLIGQRGSQLDPAAAAHHDQLGKLVLGNDALLDIRDL